MRARLQALCVHVCIPDIAEGPRRRVDRVHFGISVVSGRLFSHLHITRFSIPPLNSPLWDQPGGMSPIPPLRPPSLRNHPAFRCSSIRSREPRNPLHLHCNNSSINILPPNTRGESYSVIKAFSGQFQGVGGEWMHRTKER